jgi:hypothetical protein
MFIIIIRNGAKTISLQTSFGDLIIIRNGAKTICLQTSFGDLIRNRTNIISQQAHNIVSTLFLG